MATATVEITDDGDNLTIKVKFNGIRNLESVAHVVANAIPEFAERLCAHLNLGPEVVRDQLRRVARRKPS